MSTIYEHSAGLVKNWVGTYGNSDMQQISDDLVEVLRICHEYRKPDDKKVPVYDADDLGEAICAYINEVYSTPANFGDASDGAKPQPGSVSEAIDKMRPAAELAAEASMPPELDIPDQH
ncbi:hypothetical protein [Curtobacterium sp. MCBA15_004]|uniref:hypothetical protein n=1 Tax=Curtobacterium sp. MCBA15_004 TaxID=1898733 RepID=UPI0008DDB9E3|nr:hypothetical protein [Curtobacterium sp. MCBA15_004]WIA98038.1 hypothetical protein QOL16_06525 [Curtobacterium sp. MCBA15_004]